MNRRGFIGMLLAALGAGTSLEGQREEPRYPGVGPGHYVQEIRDGGRIVVLEDKSNWEIAERHRFITSSWAELDGVTVRHVSGEPPYAYELSNTDRDEGVLARWLRPAR